MEKKYSKDEILSAYLNIVYFNNGAYGIEAASNLYFGVHSKDLTLPQAATLAGVVNNPSFYDPITEPQRATNRRNTVLDKMLVGGKISRSDHDQAIQTPLALNIHRSGQGCVSAKTAPYFCDYNQRLILNNQHRHVSDRSEPGHLRSPKTGDQGRAPRRRNAPTL
ncbi:transglycosylase domain-containing protein [Arthrobacter sp. H14-L1]|uniref:transglycosylase domain-containing protein n=1 Tax=Arthrobacter sp. H14-L1 TaxID=2996697 RepID=UPI00226EECAB|nr:transglycosylase domain-containing protein [Arthrobacter sp. H14-L1]MCY0906257.1 transglycosylase domain-containing protein [Arthrobacter sp. H14-L1]